MTNYDIRTLQLRLLDILKAFHTVCNTHGLKYAICAGTMLGAVRHKGFIPWDDDLDVAMPRPDYNRFIQNAAEWLPAPLELVSAETDNTYPIPFAKIQDSSTTLIERPHLYYLGGCYIDIFPIDAWPANTVKRRWQAAKYFALKQLLYLVHRDPYKHGHGPDSWLPLITRRIYTMPELQSRIREVLCSYRIDREPLASCYADGLKNALPKEISCSFAPIEFEGVEVMGIKHAHQYLSKMYGDYMTIPPVEKQIQHKFYYLDLEHPYREYNG